MTQDEIIEMVREADLDWHTGWTLDDDQPNRFEVLVKLVEERTAAKEREACAKEAEDSDHVVGGRGYYDQLGDADATVRNIVAAIRARRRA